MNLNKPGDSTKIYIEHTTKTFEPAIIDLQEVNKSRKTMSKDLNK